MQNSLKNYLRVTDVLYPFSGLATVDPLKVQFAAERGSKVHAICEAIMNGMGLCDIEDSLLGYKKSFEHWLENQSIVETSRRFFCDTHGITGECDAITKNETGYTIVDFKTPARESKTWVLQGSAYAYLAKQTGYPITKIQFVRLNKDGNAPVLYEYPDKFDVFLKCLEVYKYFYL